LTAEERFSEAEALADGVETVLKFSEGADSLQDLLARIDRAFSDGEGGLVLSTIHKAKGIEWDRVFLWRWDLLPSQWARLEWQQRQERNCQYVGVTRARRELYFVGDGHE